MSTKEMALILSLLLILLPTAVYVLLTFFTLTWNSVVPDLFRMPKINKRQSFALLILTFVLGAVWHLTLFTGTESQLTDREVQKLRMELMKNQSAASAEPASNVNDGGQ